MPETAELELVVEELTETDWDLIVGALADAVPEEYEGLEIQACGCDCYCFCACDDAA